MKRFTLRTLGCPKNLVDSERIAGRLLEAGWDLCVDAGKAEVMVINTCGFIEEAIEESLEEIFEAVNLKQASGGGLKIVVVGCLSVRYMDRLAAEIPEIDALAGIDCAAEIEGILLSVCSPGRAGGICGTGRPRTPSSSSIPRFLLTPRHLAYLKVSEGCDNRCSYCVIPTLRGPFRSRPLDDLLKEAEDLAAMGVKELCLISQDTARYGHDIAGRCSIATLLRALARIDSFPWIRILYCHPAHISRGMIEAMADIPSVCRYLDIPLQHAADSILSSMNRKVTQERIENLVREIRDAIPDIALRTTFMIGYPGETDVEFELLRDFLTRMRFDHAGFFRFSPEEGTPAADLDRQIPRAVVDERLRRIMEQQTSIMQQVNRSLAGRRLRVMIDTIHDDGFEGRTEWDAFEIDRIVRVRVVDAARLHTGEFVDVDVEESDHYALSGTIAPRSGCGGNR